MIYLIFDLFRSIVGTFSSTKSHDNSLLGDRILAVITPGTAFLRKNPGEPRKCENTKLNKINHFFTEDLLRAFDVPIFIVNLTEGLPVCIISKASLKTSPFL